LRFEKNGLQSPCSLKYDVVVVDCWALEKLLAFTTILILLISGTFLFNSAIGFGPEILKTKNHDVLKENGKFKNRHEICVPTSKQLLD